MFSKIEKKYLQRCFDLAQLGNGSTSPNPCVGSVIVYDNEIIGEGWHQYYGDAHAEDGFCNSIRKAKVQGEVKDNRFKVTYFQLIPETSKEKKLDKQEGK